MEKITIYYSPQNGGDGSVYLRWFLTKKEAENDQRNLEEGWGEDCNGSVETFIGSDIYTMALQKNYE